MRGSKEQKLESVDSERHIWSPAQYWKINIYVDRSTESQKNCRLNWNESISK